VPTTADLPWKAVAQRVALQLRIIDPPAISDIVMRCVADEFEIKDREGRTGRGGFTNLKRILGRPADFAFVVDRLARTIPAGHAIAACDEGAWALGGAIALKLGGASSARSASSQDLLCLIRRQPRDRRWPAGR
jgi:hypothetical protein